MNATTARRLRSALFLLLALGAILGAGQVLDELNRQRTDLGLVGQGAIGDLPPAVVLANRAGGIFRALAINTLWMRATELQDKGEVFELVQLFRWITALEPRFPMVWAFRAWNLAYNVSVKFPAFQADERWRWVQRGIEALRDEGIPYNPKAERLYRELGWIYSHKIGDSMDDAHRYYKIQLAHQMQRVLGTPPHRPTVARAAAAPEDRQALLQDPAVRSLVEALAQAGLDPFQGDVEGTDVRLAVLTRDERLPEAARAVLEDPARAEAVAALDAFLGARILTETLKLRPALLLELMERYGPIDWRLPQAHSLYWTQRGINVAADAEVRAINTQRLAFHSLADFYRRGRLSFRYDPEHPERSLWRTTQHFGFMEKAIQFKENVAKEYEGTDQADPLRAGFLNFLREVILDLYLHNDLRRSRAYYKKLQSYGPEADVPHEEFITGRFVDRMENATYDQNLNLIRGILFDVLRWASYGDLDHARGLENLARLVRNKYNGKRLRYTIPPLKELYPEVFERALRVFRDWQIARLEELYPKQVQDARQRLEERRGQEPEPAPGPS